MMMMMMMMTMVDTAQSPAIEQAGKSKAVSVVNQLPSQPLSPTSTQGFSRTIRSTFNMAEQSTSLLSQKSSDSGLHIQLHPLILLTISDHITRHAARQQRGPIVGALLGQQNGREITLEHAFECIVVEGPNGEAQLSDGWFVERVQQRMLLFPGDNFRQY